jgi:zinc/manganese transport system permease protein
VESAEIIEIIAPPLAIGFVVAAIHAPLGIEVLRRGIVFIDLAIAQIVGLGILLVNMLWAEPSWLLRQFAIVVIAALAALFFRLIEQRLTREQEAVIGSCFIVAASGALIAVANDPHGGEELQHILSGQILFVTWSDILAFLPMYGVVAIAWAGWPSLRRGVSFFLVFALAVTASVQLVGVYVVFASLILPALAANRRETGKLGPALVCGGTAVLCGIAASTLMDLPAGPVLVVCYALATVVIRHSPWAHEKEGTAAG